jgi:glycosyltransferase involved in cell wall biosynthesis
VFREKLFEPSEIFINKHVHSISDKVEVLLAGFVCNNDNIDKEVNYAYSNSFTCGGKINRFALKYFGFPKDLLNIIKNFSPDVIHAHFATDAVLIYKLAKKLNIPMVVTVHGYEVSITPKSFLKSPSIYSLNYLVRRRALTKYVNYFLCVSNYILNEAILNGLPKEKLKLHYLGIDVADVAKSCDKVRNKSFTICFVGRFVEKKGLIYLLEAVRILKDSGYEVRLEIIGDGPLKKQFLSYANTNKLEVNFHGFIKNELVKKYITQADIFCMPSTKAENGDNEGLPTVFMESLCLKTPIVSFEQGPIPEIVKIGSGGRLAKDKCSIDLAEKILYLMQNPDLLIKESLNGFKFVENDFNIEVQSMKLVDTYKVITTC